MSRTDKTRPWWVKVLDPRHPQEVHDHRLGECDLLTKEEWVKLLSANDMDAIHSHRCTWYLKQKYLNEISDGCEMCTNHAFHIQENRKKRHNHKREARNLSREYRSTHEAE